MDKSRKLNDKELDSIDAGMSITFDNGNTYEVTRVYSKGLEFVMEYEVSGHGLARDQRTTCTKSYTTKDCGQWYNPVSWVKRAAVELSITLGVDHNYKAGQEE